MTFKKSTLPIKQLWIFSVGLLLLLIIINPFFLLDIPPVWPDEALHADLTLNILNQRSGTDLLGGTIPGAEVFGFGYPPLYFYTSALWFKIFGFSIFIYRLLSFSLGLIFLVIFAMVSLKLAGKRLRGMSNYFKLLLVIGGILLMTDVEFNKAIHIARPAIEVLVLGFLSVFFYLKVSETKEKRKRILFSAISGLSLGLAFITHYLAAIFLISLVFYIIISNFKHFYKQKEFYAFGLALLSILIVWFISIYPYLNYFLNDMALRINYKTNAPYWIWIVFASSSLLTKVVYLLYLIISWEMLMAYLFYKNPRALLVLSLNFSSWVLSYIWQTEFAFIYVVVSAYLSLVYLLVSSLESKETRFKFKLYIIIAVSFLILNSINLASALKQFQGDNFSYQVFSDSIKPLIPEGASVYISSIPDPYFAFKDHNKIYEIPFLPTKKEDFEKVLDEVDYIIFNFPHELPATGNVTVPYIEKNAEHITEVGQENQYRAIVVKLKSKEARIK